MSDSVRRDILLHPLILGAMFVYFANNLILQRWIPSQLTGKISDFAWLFFVPIVVYSFWGKIFPRIARSQIGVFVWGFIGVGFVLVKANPAVNQIVSNGISDLFNVPVAIIVDPWDNIALIALVFSFYFFRSRYWSEKHISLTSVLVAVSITALLTLADAAAEDYGIACFTVDGDRVIASSTYASYASQDGGETWQEYEDDERCWYSTADQNKLFQVKKDALSIQFRPGHPIQISTDNGKHWKIEYDIEPDTEAQRAYYKKYREGSPVILKGPLDAVIDSGTGNVVFAMGHEGVLIRKADSTWKWVTVGPYSRVNYQDIDLYKLLWGEGVLAISAGFLVIVVFGSKVMEGQIWKRIGTIALTVVTWMLLGLSMFSFPPAINYGYGNIVSGFVVMAVAVLTTIAVIFALARLGKRGYIKKELLLYAIVVMVLFFFPYMLWFENILQDYNTAAWLAFIFLAGITTWSYWKVKTA